MNREALIEATRSQMPEKRWRHVQGVVDTAVELAERFGGDKDKAWLAALLHDYTKAWATDRMEKLIREEDLPKELLEHDKELWHAHVGAWVVRREHGIDDEEVLDAIRYHTSGRERMTLLDKIVCLADYIEPGRDFPGVNRIRELAQNNLEEALLAGFDGTIKLLVDQGKRIFPLTVLARNDLLLTIIKNKG
ncbi:bis(5'-nucleosyl)-tetraphosphatase (symmetrical) YqeK [Cohnella thailandensis]|uniref:bis(5'-nucleosyl)-tetraphosphatase (symmetrical) n=1 Tax=Cohnella thailandensis TaxID=557557 RepID=A0A841SZW6_9BACL|nr:bis(5'-nucleosyl)-tetraphosphatase (symmetrical) YqeK [Cohnella thailandensis]MBB6636166.1 bis(5'-nucleosyl)-tetraphosphatase (symmetrical) YqeK [Cohnella thailandensis]MBP1973865.1 putative HD superfamily hydrolase involved in NAD metabolism [Cohnella thailandensis]